MEFVGLRFMDDRKQIATDAIAGRFHHANHRVSSNGRIDGISATLQDLHSGHRRQRLTAGDNPESRGNHRTSRRGQS